MAHIRCIDHRLAGPPLPESALNRIGFALTARGAVQVEGKGEMRTFLLMPANNSTHSVKGAEK